MSTSINSTVFYFFMLLFPIIGFLIQLPFNSRNSTFGAKISTAAVWMGGVFSAGAWIAGFPFLDKNELWGFIANEISWLMASLILFVSGVVHLFSLRYLDGDRNYHRYFISLSLITVSTLLMMASDNILFLVMFWMFSNMILVLLMIHKWEWSAAKNSGMLALKTFLVGLIFLIPGVSILMFECSSLSMHHLAENCHTIPSFKMTLALFFIMIAAFSQSGGWPFHKWLISSLNSPTPVSAFMHAGLVNGGGVLLARFAPLYLQEPVLLNYMFLFATATLILGGIWKLLQSHVKGMLACSTMTQMGFMMMQCALGLFPAALTHLCWHGLFKAFLFLRSGSIVLDRRHSEEKTAPNPAVFLLSIGCGMLGALGFAWGTGFSVKALDTTVVLIFFSWVGASQIAYTLFKRGLSLTHLLLAVPLCLVAGAVYGLTVDLVEQAMAPLEISKPQPLHWIHLFIIAIIFSLWGVFNFISLKRFEDTIWWRRFYVKMLNMPQPHQDTTTVCKNGYHF